VSYNNQRTKVASWDEEYHDFLSVSSAVYLFFSDGLSGVELGYIVI